MTFNELVDEHWLPTVQITSTITLKNYRSHLGDGSGKPSRTGGKAARAARFQLRTVFGNLRIADIGPQHVRVWQTGMREAGYLHGSILAKRSLLRGIFRLAVVNGWMDLNPVDAVPEPPKVQTEDEDRVITPEDWLLIRARLSGELTLLLVDVTLDTGLRFGEITALRSVDVRDATADEPQHLWVRRAVIWPGRKFTGTGQPWELKEYPKGRAWRKVAVTRDLYDRLVAYVDAQRLTEDALVFDYGRLRAEHAIRRERDPLPTRAPHGRYVNPKTGRSGAHGRYTTYTIGCRCPFCRNAYTEYRFWWARARGRRAAQPWLDADYLATRRDAVDPCPNQWFAASVWKPAVLDAGLGWEPTFHDLRHAMVTWSLEGDAPPRVVQQEAGHAQFRTTEIYVHRLDKRVSRERLVAIARMCARMNGEPDEQADTAAGEDDHLAELLASPPPDRIAEILATALSRRDRAPLRAVGGRR